jgi:RNA polymerase sigma-70 factor, ECF subfamily
MDRLSSLVEEARHGSSSAMEEFVRSSYVEVRRLCASLVDEASAQDLTQETFLRVVRQLPRFRGESSARTWIFSIAHHICMDELRARTRARRPAMHDTASNRSIGPDPAESACVADFIAGLEPDRRAAFVLTQLFGLSYAEVATLADCAAGTVASRVARARSQLIATMELGEDLLDAQHRPNGANPAARADD